MTKKDSKTLPTPVDSIDEAEKIIYEKTKQGINNRDIVKIEFDINGILRKFNPYQIKKIKEKFQTPILDNKNQDKAVLFELFNKDYDVIRAVIKTKLDPKFVNDTWMEYLEIKNIFTIPKSTYDQLIVHGREFGTCDTINDVLKQLKVGIDASKELNRFYFPCRVCQDPVIIDEHIIKTTIRWMQAKWTCSKQCQREAQN